MVYVWFSAICGFAEEVRQWNENPHIHRMEVYLGSERHKKGLKADVSTYQVIKVIRDPYSRAASIFRHAIKYPIADKEMREWSGGQFDPVMGISFDQFLDFAATLDMNECNPHFRPQRHPFEEVRKPDIVINMSREDLFGRLETVARERGWPEVRFDEMAWAHEMPSSRRAQTSTTGAELDRVRLNRLEHVLSFPPYSRLLTESARRKIETIYRVDFEAYRESFGSEPSLLASSSSRTNGAIQPQQGFPMSKKAEISPERQRQRRLIYFKQRVPLLRDEMKRLMEETQEIAKKIKHAGESPSPTMKSARERLIYLTEHKSTLQKELTAVLEEQQTLLTGDKKAS